MDDDGKRDQSYDPFYLTICVTILLIRTDASHPSANVADGGTLLSLMILFSSSMRSIIILARNLMNPAASHSSHFLPLFVLAGRCFSIFFFHLDVISLFFFVRVAIYDAHLRDSCVRRERMCT